MLVVKYGFVEKAMASKQLHRGILCYLCLIAILIYFLYKSGTVSLAMRDIRTVSVVNLSKHLTTTTFKRIKETYSKIAKDYRRQKKKYMSAESISLSETTQELYPFCPSDLFLLILVQSRPNSVHNRIAMRLTFARKCSPSKEGDIIGNLTCQVVFVIKGRSRKRGSLTKESKRYGDILRMKKNNGAGETSRLTRPTVISAIERLLARKCKPKFLLVLGNDTFVYVPEVISWLLKLNPNVVYTGSVKLSKIAVVDNLSETPIKVQSTEKPYCVEGAYVLAGKILKNIVNASKIISFSQHGISSEAMYIGILAYSLGITPYNDARFTSRPFEDLNLRDINPCTVKKQVFVHHVFRVRHILLYTKAIVVGKQPCINMM